MANINNFSAIAKMDPINKGWSSDKKYYVETEKGEKLLLRTADLSEHNKKKQEFEMMKRLAESDIPMSQPIDFGIDDRGKRVYSFFTWCDGEDAAIVLPKLSEMEQYELGVKSGQILRKIHDMPAPDDREDWEKRFNRKIDSKIKLYQDCSIKFNGDDRIIRYIEANRHLLAGRPQCFQHGDYHVGNMIISPQRELFIIDFNRWDYGDPWEEFNRIVWSVAASPHFAAGQLHGYFNGKPPMQFFQLLALYICTNTLSSIPWAISFGDEEVLTMKKQAKDVLSWFDGMNNPIPAWYNDVIKEA